MTAIVPTSQISSLEINTGIKRNHPISKGYIFKVMNKFKIHVYKVKALNVFSSRCTAYLKAKSKSNMSEQPPLVFTLLTCNHVKLVELKHFEIGWFFLIYPVSKATITIRFAYFPTSALFCQYLKHLMANFTNLSKANKQL